MKVAVMTDIKTIEFEEREIPEIKEGEVLVQIEYVGICGSDLHYFEDGRIGDYIVEPPFVLGHEASGEIVKIGNNVKHLKVGDKVALEPGITCGECNFCKEGKYNLCSDVIFFATPPVDGVFQEYVNHPADLCFKLPENVSTLEGALIEPLSVGFHGGLQGRAKFGMTAVVTGAGCIGLASLLALKALGVTDIYITDIMENRLEKAMELGATGVINSSKEDPVEKMKEITGNKGEDLYIETAGTESTIRQGIFMAKKGSTIVFVGYPRDGEAKIPISLAMDKELKFETVFRYRNIYPLAIKAVSEEIINLKDLVTHIFEFEDTQEAMSRSLKEKDEIVKAVIKIK